MKYPSVSLFHVAMHRPMNMQLWNSVNSSMSFKWIFVQFVKNKLQHWNHAERQFPQCTFTSCKANYAWIFRFCGPNQIEHWSKLHLIVRKKLSKIHIQNIPFGPGVQILSYLLALIFFRIPKYQPTPRITLYLKLGVFGLGALQSLLIFASVCWFVITQSFVDGANETFVLGFRSIRNRNFGNTVGNATGLFVVKLVSFKKT